MVGALSLRPVGVLVGAHGGGVVAGVFLVRVLGTAQAELAAWVLPCLTLTIPMETKLRQLLPNLGGGLLLERNPNPLADNFRKAVKLRRAVQQKVQNLFSGQGAVFLPRLGVNRQAIVRLRLRLLAQLRFVFPVCCSTVRICS